MVQHLACQMDGNRRWAVRQGLDPLQGHTRGIDTIRRVVEFCLEKKIPYLSLYTLSLENLKRSERETSHLFGLMTEHFKQGSTFLKECIEQGVRIRFLGDWSRIPVHLAPLCEHAQEKTKQSCALYLNFLFCYGGRQEIIAGVQRLVSNIAQGTFSLQELETLSPETFKKFLWLGDLPDPDLIIRPGDVVRLSNFMLFSSAYSEWYFTPKLWPELQVQDFQEALDDYHKRSRRFGA